MEFNSFLLFNKSLATVSYSIGFLSFPSSKILLICAKTSAFWALLEWSSMQNMPRPVSSSLFLTTSKAAIFWATNKTFLWLYKLFIIIFVIVCDFPVPGGPFKTKLKPLDAFIIASVCELSALKGVAKRFGAI